MRSTNKINSSWRQLQAAGGARVDWKLAEAVAGECDWDAATGAVAGCKKKNAACDWG
jgi:hypothetical protein